MKPQPPFRYIPGGAIGDDPIFVAPEDDERFARLQRRERRNVLAMVLQERLLLSPHIDTLVQEVTASDRLSPETIARTAVAHADALIRALDESAEK